MHRNGIPALFAFYPMPDMHDSTLTVANLDQGQVNGRSVDGITLPNRDYYINDDDKLEKDPIPNTSSTSPRRFSCSATRRMWPTRAPRRSSSHGDGIRQGAFFTH